MLTASAQTKGTCFLAVEFFLVVSVLDYSSKILFGVTSSDEVSEDSVLSILT
jgi:hypothetical protein